MWAAAFNNVDALCRGGRQRTTRRGQSWEAEVCAREPFGPRLIPCDTIDMGFHALLFGTKTWQGGRVKKSRHEQDL
jgi:hypothetical protein